MSTKQDSEGFLQPIFSTFGLITSALSAIAPIFAQGQLGTFFIESQLSLSASIVSLLLGIILSWQIFSAKGYLNIPIGKRKDRGSGYPQAWKTISSDNITSIVFVILVVLFVAFFGLNQSNGHFLGVIQATLYILFFALLIATFSLLLARTRSSYEWEQQILNVGGVVYETLERTGNVQSGIKIQKNIEASTDSLPDGLKREYGVRHLVVTTVSQNEQTLNVYTSSDYKRLLAVSKIDTDRDTN